MNCFNQLDNGLFASEEDLKALSNKEKVKILVYSDSHGIVQTPKDILKTFGTKIDALVFAGDGIWDLCSILEYSYKNDEAKDWIPPVVAFARGNNDSNFASTSFCSKIYVPRRVQFNACGRSILVTHGHEEGVYYTTDGLERLADLTNSSAVIFGHTHVPTEYNHRIYSMNPGSCSLPRRNSEKSFAILEVTKKYISAVFYKINYSQNPPYVPYFPEIYDF